MRNYLVTNKNTRVFNVDLANAIGLNESIVLQQIQYWIDIKESDPEKYADSNKDVYMWVYNSFEKWNEQMPFWCLRTLKTIFKNLENNDILIVGRYNKMGYDKTKWYRINYEKLYEKVLESKVKSHSAKIALSKVQELHDGKCRICTTNTKEYAYDSTENTIHTSFLRNDDNMFDFLKYYEEDIYKQIDKLEYVEEYDNIKYKNTFKLLFGKSLAMFMYERYKYCGDIFPIKHNHLQSMFNGFLSGINYDYGIFDYDSYIDDDGVIEDLLLAIKQSIEDFIYSKANRGKRLPESFFSQEFLGVYLAKKLGNGGMEIHEILYK